MIASLPMYDWPETRCINDTLWQLLYNNLQARGVDAPQHLSRSNNEESHWLSPDLLLSQTCGYPLSTLLREKVQYLTTPVYDVAGCEGGYYSSVLVARKGADIEAHDMTRSHFAYNSKFSWSGYRCIIREFGALENVFSTLVESGGHRNSARWVAAGKADIAALDAVCWHMLQHHEPKTTNKLKAVYWTKKHPSLPFITALDRSVPVAQNLVAAMKEVIASAEFAEIRELLPIVECVEIDVEIYMALGREA